MAYADIALSGSWHRIILGSERLGGTAWVSLGNHSFSSHSKIKTPSQNPFYKQGHSLDYPKYSPLQQQRGFFIFLLAQIRDGQ